MGQLPSKAIDDAEIDLTLFGFVRHGCRSAAKEWIAIDGLARSCVRRRPARLKPHAPMRVEVVFRAAPEVVCKPVTEAEDGFTVDRGDAVVRKTQTGHNKGAELPVWRQKLIESTELVHVEIHI